MTGEETEPWGRSGFLGVAAVRTHVRNQCPIVPLLETEERPKTVDILWRKESVASILGI